MKKGIEIETIRAGQPRPYADSVLEQVFRFTGGYSERLPWTPDRELVKSIVEGISNHNKPLKEKDAPREWHEDWLESLERVGEREWRVVIISPYLD